MKTVLIAVAAVLSTLTLFAETRTSAIGFWKTIDDETGEAKSIVRIYEYEGKVYGRVHRVLGDRTAKAKIKGEPLIEGLDIIRDLKKSANGKLEGGKVLDPQNGRSYTCQIWLDEGKLVMRGSLFGIGRKQIWLPAETPEDATATPVPAPKF